MNALTPRYVAIDGKKVSIEHLSVNIENALEAADSLERDLPACESCGSSVPPNKQRIYCSSTEPEKSGVYHTTCDP